MVSQREIEDWIRATTENIPFQDGELTPEQRRVMQMYQSELRSYPIPDRDNPFARTYAGEEPPISPSVYSGTSPPSNPRHGDMWLDPDGYRMRVFDSINEIWEREGDFQYTPPQNPRHGDTWKPSSRVKRRHYDGRTKTWIREDHPDLPSLLESLKQTGHAAEGAADAMTKLKTALEKVQDRTKDIDPAKVFEWDDEANERLFKACNVVRHVRCKEQSEIADFQTRMNVVYDGKDVLPFEMLATISDSMQWVLGGFASPEECNASFPIVVEMAFAGSIFSQLSNGLFEVNNRRVSFCGEAQEWRDIDDVEVFPSLGYAVFDEKGTMVKLTYWMGVERTVIEEIEDLRKDLKAKFPKIKEEDKPENRNRTEQLKRTIMRNGEMKATDACHLFDFPDPWCEAHKNLEKFSYVHEGVRWNYLRKPKRWRRVRNPQNKTPAERLKEKFAPEEDEEDKDAEDLPF